jgi:tRNA C32,U32 (ribose-2'-O)-methylase TrmJ
VLCRPQGPRNVGSVVRAAANFGPAEVLLVGPVRPSLLVHPDFVQMAHGVEQLASRVRVVDSLAAALADCTGSFGFTARARDHRVVRDWREVLAEAAERAARPEERLAFVFGSEESGLSGEETAPLHELVRIPTSAEHGSLNLAFTAGLVLAQLFLSAAPSAARPAAAPLPGDERAFLIEQLKFALGARTTSAPARRDLEASIERVFARAPLETRDARAWHLLARALGSDKRPQDFGCAPPPKAPRTHSRAADARAGAADPPGEARPAP